MAHKDFGAPSSSGATLHFSISSPRVQSLNSSPFLCSFRVNVHPYQHGPVQSQVPHRVSSVPASYLAGYSTPASTRPAMYKYTREKPLAHAAPIHLTLKPEQASKSCALIEDCLVPGRAAVMHGQSLNSQVSAYQPTAKSPVKFRHISPPQRALSSFGISAHPKEPCPFRHISPPQRHLSSFGISAHPKDTCSVSAYQLTPKSPVHFGNSAVYIIGLRFSHFSFAKVSFA